MRIVPVALISMLLSTVAFAEPPSDESLDRLLVAGQVEKLVQSIQADSARMMHQALESATAGQTLSDEQRRILNNAEARFTQVIKDEMDWSVMRPFYLDLYRETFTQEEVDGLIAFYTSPAGMAYVAKMPVVAQKAMAQLQARMAWLRPRMEAAMRDAVNEAKSVTKQGE